MKNIIRLFSYWIHRLSKPKKMIISMSFLVKDEIDIIESNIRYHSAIGIDSFVVMDNASSDGTRELLTKLQKEFDLHIIDQPDQSYQQGKWVTEMAEYCKKVFNAGFVISNDADEFWEVQNGKSLKDCLHKKDSIVTVKRFNMALPEESLNDGYNFRDNKLLVKGPIMNKTESTESMLLQFLQPKVIINPYGLRQINTGMHRANHIWQAFSKRTTNDIIIYHYPIRNFSQFEKRIATRVSLIEKVVMPKQYRNWIKSFQNGTLKDEYKKLTLTKNEVDNFIKLGIIELRNPKNFTSTKQK